MAIKIGLRFCSHQEFARSGCGVVALSQTCPEEEVERVLGHEAVHLALEDLLIEDYDPSVGQMMEWQQFWDLYDLGIAFDPLTKKITVR